MAGKSSPTLLFLGAVYIDHLFLVDSYPEEDSKGRASDYSVRVGGNAPNSCMAIGSFLRRLGGTVSLLSSLASPDDASGQSTLQVYCELAEHGVTYELCTRFALHRNSSNPISTILSSKASGSRTIVSHRDLPEVSPSAFLECFESVRVNASGGLWVHFEGRNVDATIEALRMVRSFGYKGSVELEKPYRTLEPLVPEADVIFVSQSYYQARAVDKNETPQMYLQRLRKMARDGAILCLTVGAAGCYFLDSTQIVTFVPATKIDEVVDSVGAGDSFIGSAVLALAYHCAPEVAFSFATRVAGAKCTQMGYRNLAERVDLPF